MMRGILSRVLRSGPQSIRAAGAKASIGSFGEAAAPPFSRGTHSEGGGGGTCPAGGGGGGGILSGAGEGGGPETDERAEATKLLACSNALSTSRRRFSMLSSRGFRRTACPKGQWPSATSTSAAHVEQK